MGLPTGPWVSDWGNNKASAPDFKQTQDAPPQDKARKNMRGLKARLMILQERPNFPALIGYHGPRDFSFRRPDAPFPGVAPQAGIDPTVGVESPAPLALSPRFRNGHRSVVNALKRSIILPAILYKGAPWRLG